MTYRDDREALLLQIEALKEDLKRAGPNRDQAKEKLADLAKKVDLATKSLDEDRRTLAQIGDEIRTIRKEFDHPLSKDQKRPEENLNQNKRESVFGGVAGLAAFGFVAIALIALLMILLIPRERKADSRPVYEPVAQNEHRDAVDQPRNHEPQTFGQSLRMEMPQQAPGLRGVASSEGTEESDEPSDLPSQPSRSQVRRTMGSVAGQVMNCRRLVDRQTRVNATFVISNSGHVTSVTVSGGSPTVQTCVQRAVWLARFPEFTNPRFTVTYPFVLTPDP